LHWEWEIFYIVILFKTGMKFIFKNVDSKSKKIKNIPITWEKKESEILDKIRQLTGLILKTEKIICTMDGSTSDGYYGYNNITLGVKGGIIKDDVLMVISHELFHIFYWKKVRKMKLSKGALGKESKKEWELAEITAYLITEELKSFWPCAKVYLYPEIKNLYKKVKKYWGKDFESFLKKSYKIIK